MVKQWHDELHSVLEWALLATTHTSNDTDCLRWPGGIVCSQTSTFRLLARRCVHAHRDAVLEIGSSYGVCTHVLAQALGDARRVVGVDTSKELVAAATARYPDLRFERADALATPHVITAIVRQLLARAPTAAAADVTTPAAVPQLVVFVDIGGNRELEALVALLPWVQAALKPRLVVCKSETLFDAGTEAEGQLDWPALRRAADAAVTARRSAAGGGGEGEGGGGEGSRRARAMRAHARVLPHPLRAPLRRNASGVPICRFHNYALRHDGWVGSRCKAGAACAFDHETCHWCGKVGHIALHCDADVQPLL